MDENLSRALNIVFIAIFFLIAVSVAFSLEKSIKASISSKKEKNYLSPALALKYTGEGPSTPNCPTQNRMMLSNVFLEKSREEGEDIIVECFGERVNLLVRDDSSLRVTDQKGNDIKANEIRTLLQLEKIPEIELKFDRLELEAIVLKN